jgi:hypothetical protein
MVRPILLGQAKVSQDPTALLSKLGPCTGHMGFFPFPTFRRGKWQSRESHIQDLKYLSTRLELRISSSKQPGIESWTRIHAGLEGHFTQSEASQSLQSEKNPVSPLPIILSSSNMALMLEFYTS